jgi:iron-sulfur cluster assembly protein
MDTIIQSPVTFTDGAVEEINRLMNEPTFDKNLQLRVGVKGGGCSGLSYVLGFDAPKEGDAYYQANGFQFIMEKAHEMYLLGMQIDWQGGLSSRGFTFKNPNASSTCGCGTSFAV